MEGGYVAGSESQAQDGFDPRASELYIRSVNGFRSGWTVVHNTKSKGYHKSKQGKIKEKNVKIEKLKDENKQLKKQVDYLKTQPLLSIIKDA